jgi:hypothetical protein
MTPVHNSMARFFLPMPLWPQIVDPRSSPSMGSVFIGGKLAGRDAHRIVQKRLPRGVEYGIRSA